eukprot:TRINITY_DN1954_c0_g1_i6.p1 TRINITY_DN1954_c0_g1~~TRINITY_DN1954_c0_g1_i6.p1  ORF type:complete len:284 (+),score=41.80 TRINITY_DN1954_c0_g1_i6:255-1106(+)
MCNEQVIRSSLVAHVCLDTTLRPCPFSSVGCKEVFSPKELLAHLDSPWVQFSHLKLACETIVILKNEISEKTEKITKINSENSELKSQLEEIKAHPKFHQLLSEIKGVEHFQDVYSSPEFLDRYASLRNDPPKLISKLVLNGDGVNLVKVLRTLEKSVIDAELVPLSGEAVKIATSLVWDTKLGPQELLKFVPLPLMAQELLEHIPNPERTSYSCIHLVQSFNVPLYINSGNRDFTNKWIELVRALKVLILFFFMKTPPSKVKGSETITCSYPWFSPPMVFTP